jgi:hypothetical protein
MATKVSTSENKVLFGVINWGIGHATRSSVIIDALLKRGFSVDILSNGEALRFLKDRYRERCTYVEGYNFEEKYSDARLGTYLRLAKEIFYSFKQDSRLLKRLMLNGDYGCFINDCRPLNPSAFLGCKVLVNHQLTPKWPFLKSFCQEKLNTWQRRFDAVWVPDFEGSILSGSLSDDSALQNLVWIGPLSRLQLINEKKGMGVLFFGFKENEISESVLKELTQNGLPYIFANKKTDDSQELLNNAQCVVSKPGYSSVMELYNIQKPVLLLDRKWHAEQHVLFEHLVDKQLFYGAANLSVQDVLGLSSKKPLKPIRTSDEKLLTLALDTILNEYCQTPTCRR